MYRLPPSTGLWPRTELPGVLSQPWGATANDLPDTVGAGFSGLVESARSCGGAGSRECSVDGVNTFCSSPASGRRDDQVRAGTRHNAVPPLRVVRPQCASPVEGDVVLTTDRARVRPRRGFALVLVSHDAGRYRLGLSSDRVLELRERPTLARRMQPPGAGEEHRPDRLGDQASAQRYLCAAAVCRGPSPAPCLCWCPAAT